MWLLQQLLLLIHLCSAVIATGQIRSRRLYGDTSNNEFDLFSHAASIVDDTFNDHDGSTIQRALVDERVLMARLNCGSFEFNDTVTGRKWFKDRYFEGGENFTVPDTTAIANTQNDPLFRSHRHGDFTYEIPILPGTWKYEVIFYFAEIFWSSEGKRVFDVTMEGKNVINDLDIYKQASGKFTALVKKYEQIVSDGFLSIKFDGVIDGASISGIEVYFINVPVNIEPTIAPTPTPIPPTETLINIQRRNVGSGEFINPVNGRKWFSDKFFSGGETYLIANNTDIQNTANDMLYRSNREGNFSYEIPVFEGPSLYEITFHFAEIVWTKQGERVFDVFVEGQRVITNLDIFKQASGRLRALDLTVRRVVRDGSLSIRFSSKIEKASLSGLEVDFVYNPAGLATDPPTIAPTIMPTISPTPPPAMETLINIDRLNCGSFEFNSPVNGRKWFTDKYFVGGKNYTVPNTTQIANTENDPLFRSHRYGDFKYEIPVFSGPSLYEVVFYFAEIFWNTTSERVFDISIEGQNVVRNLDIADRAGDTFTALSIKVRRIVRDGSLTIEFTSNVDEAALNGLEVYFVYNTAGLITDPPTPAPTSLTEAPTTIAPTTIAPTTIAPTQSPTQFVPKVLYRLNSGSFAFTDASSGIEWEDDDYFSGGKDFTVQANVQIMNTDNDELYQSHRYGNFTYELPVSEETQQYDVTLHFAETFWMNVGQRVFDVTIEGNKVLENFDIVKQTSEWLVAFTRTYRVEVEDGSLTIEFDSIFDSALISGVEVKEADLSQTLAPTISPTTSPTIAPTISPTTSPTIAPTIAPTTAPTPIPTLSPDDSTREILVRLNCGNGEYNDTAAGFAWMEDMYFTGGKTFTAPSNIAVEGTDSDTIYQTHRFGNFTYEIPLTEETQQYDIVLHFAETFFETAESRIFDIFIEGSKVAEDVDIFEQAPGTYNALTLSYRRVITDGSLTIKFESKVNNALVSGIEVFSVTPLTST